MLPAMFFLCVKMCNLGVKSKGVILGVTSVTLEITSKDVIFEFTSKGLTKGCDCWVYRLRQET